MPVFNSLHTESIIIGRSSLRVAYQICKRDGWRISMLFLLLFCLMPAIRSFAVENEAVLRVTTGNQGSLVTIERELSDESILVSVSDAEKKPLFGLTKDDFVVTASGRTAKIISAQPVEESLGVPRNITLVLDNSESMRLRNAVVPLLAGVDELLKIMRPIDNMQIVVFTKKEKLTLGGRDLRVRTFKSNKPTELKNFITEIYRDGVTPSTVLFEAMLAGLDLIQTAPENEPRFLVVFSDGEDISSAYGKKDVIKVSEGLNRFNAYAIDYMPSMSTDKFLKSFAESNRGQIWKATSETNLVPIFQSVASRMQYHYEITYLFPPAGRLAVDPPSLNINELEAFGTASQPERSKGAAPPQSPSAIIRSDNSKLTLRPVVDTAYGIERWKMALTNASGNLIEKDGEGAPPAEIIVPLKTDILGTLAAGGDINILMEVHDRKGQSLIMTTPPVTVNYLKSTGSLGISPASLEINELEALDAASLSGHSAGPVSAKGSVINRIDTSSLTLRPIVDKAYDFVRWKITLTNANGTFKEKDGEGAPPTEIVVQLKTDELRALAAGGDIKAVMKIHDASGQILTLTAPPVTVKYFKTTGSLSVVPASLEINEFEALDVSSQPDRSSAALAKGSISSRIDTSSLTLRPVVDRAYNFVRWKMTLANASGTLIEKDGEGTPPTEIVVPLKTDELGELAAGGDIKATLNVHDDNGQNIILSAPPVTVNYFKTTGSFAVSPAKLLIEEIQTIDSSPLLGHIYFLKGSSDISGQYVRFSGPEKTTGYDEQSFRDTIEKYYQVLNIIGKRLTDRPAATITLTGCNDNIGPEKQNKKLSTARAEAVRNYFQTVWNIAPSRITTEARNLPETPSTGRLEEGQAENRRVEIRSDDSAVLAPIRSTYLSIRIDTEALILSPVVQAAHGVSHWTVRAANNGWELGELSGEGPPPAQIKVPLKIAKPTELADIGEILLTMVLADNKGQQLELTANPIKVDFIQKSQRLAQKQDFKVQEKYALILFDFDSDSISARNQEIVNTIVARIRELPQAIVDIVGHTDTIGEENYNIKLSQRRALSVYRLLIDAYGPDSSDRIHQAGVGPNDPLFDNMTPETRAFNRTVTITLEYMEGD